MFTTRSSSIRPAIASEDHTYVARPGMEWACPSRKVLAQRFRLPSAEAQPVRTRQVTRVSDSDYLDELHSHSSRIAGSAAPESSAHAPWMCSSSARATTGSLSSPSLTTKRLFARPEIVRGPYTTRCRVADRFQLLNVARAQDLTVVRTSVVCDGYTHGHRAGCPTSTEGALNG